MVKRKNTIFFFPFFSFPIHFLGNQTEELGFGFIIRKERIHPWIDTSEENGERGVKSKLNRGRGANWEYGIKKELN